jgi:putative ABC transport system permease protein
MELKDIHFHLDYRPFLLTAAAFIFIFTTVIVRTYLRMRNIDIADLLKEDKKSEGKQCGRKDLVLGALGFIILIGSVPLLVIIANEEDLNSNPAVLMIYMLVAFLGVYLSVSKLGGLIVHLIRNTGYYYRNILSITQLYHKFNQNKKIIFVLSVLSTMTIFLVASPFSLLSLCDKVAAMGDNHLEYVETGSINHLPEEALDSLLSDRSITNNQVIKFLFLNSIEGSNDLKTSKPVVSISEYNSLTGSNLTLAKDEAYNIVIDWIPGNHGIDHGKSYSFYMNNGKYTYKFLDSMSGKWIASTNSFPADSVVVISDEDYAEVSSAAKETNIGYYHLIRFKSWKDRKTF